MANTPPRPQSRIASIFRKAQILTALYLPFYLLDHTFDTDLSLAFIWCSLIPGLATAFLVTFATLRRAYLRRPLTPEPIPPSGGLFVAVAITTLLTDPLLPGTLGIALLPPTFLVLTIFLLGCFFRVAHPPFLQALLGLIPYGIAHWNRFSLLDPNIPFPQVPQFLFYAAVLSFYTTILPSALLFPSNGDSEASSSQPPPTSIEPSA